MKIAAEASNINETDEVLSVHEFAQRYRVSVGLVYKELKSGRLLAKKFGSRTLISRSEAKRWEDALPSYKSSAA